MLCGSMAKDFTGGQDKIKPNLSPEEEQKVRENYEFSANM